MGPVALMLPRVSADCRKGVARSFDENAAACWIAAKVRPVAPTLSTGLITTGATLAAAYGFELSQSQVGAISAASVALMTALVIRPQSTPKADPRPVDGAPAA